MESNTIEGRGIFERHQRSIVVSVLTLAIVILVVHALSYAFISDDAYITFRYSWNLAFHGQAAFNLGERVEGYTNFLWMVMLAVFLKAGLKPEVMSQVLGLLSGSVGLILLYLLTRLYRGGRRTPWDLLGVAVLPFLSGYVIWCTGGLETQLFSALVLGGMTIYLAESAGHFRFRYSGGVFALAAMTRPEGLLVFGLTGVHRIAHNLWVERRLWPRSEEVLWLLGFAIPFGLFFWWRVSYYGYPFPNTFYVKAGGNHWLEMKKWGIPYLWDFIRLNGLYVLVPFLLFLFRARTTWRSEAAKAAAREGQVDGSCPEEESTAVEKMTSVEGATPIEETRTVEKGSQDEGGNPSFSPWPAAGLSPRFVLSYVALIALTFTAYVVYVGGDFMANGRFFMPVLPLWIFLGQEGLREALEGWPGPASPERWRPWRLGPLLGLLLVGAAFNAVSVHRLNDKMSYSRWGLDTVAYLRKFASDRIKVGRWLRRHVPRDTVLSVGGAGAIVYASRLKAIDSYGLNDAWIAHHGPRNGDRPGHSKSAPQSYILGKRPDLMCHRAHHQDWVYRPATPEASYWRGQGYGWVCIDPPGLHPRNYCCLKRLAKDLSVWPAEREP